MDELRELVEGLWELQRRIFGAAWPRDIDEVIERYYILLTKEAGEVLDHVNFKHHKKKKPIDIKSLQEETIDVLIYALELSGAAFDGDYDSMMNSLREKVGYNEVRQDWDVNHRKVS